MSLHARCIEWDLLSSAMVQTAGFTACTVLDTQVFLMWEQDHGLYFAFCPLHLVGAIDKTIFEKPHPLPLGRLATPKHGRQQLRHCGSLGCKLGQYK